MIVHFRGSFAKDLKAIADMEVKARVQRVIDETERAQRLSEMVNLKKLRGGKSYYRIRAGDYRIGITIEGNDVTFIRFLHRKDIYRCFP